MGFNWTRFLLRYDLQLVKLGNGDRPKYGDKCLVQCIFVQKSLEKEETLQSGLSPLKFWLPLGRGFYSRSLEQIVADLRVGSECVIRSLYDDEKYTNVVAIQLSLLDIIRADSSSMEAKDTSCVLQVVSQLKQEAKQLLSQPLEQSQGIRQAIEKYQEALHILNFGAASTNLEESSYVELSVGLHCNLAICYNKLSKPFMAWLHCNAVLKSRPTQVKALYQRAKAYLQIGDLVNAYKDIHVLESSDEGNNMEVRQLKKTVEKAINEQSQQNEKQVAENFQVVLDTTSFLIPWKKTSSSTK